VGERAVCQQPAVAASPTETVMWLS